VVSSPDEVSYRPIGNLTIQGRALTSLPALSQGAWRLPLGVTSDWL
jgi:hypothetical protein